MELLKRTAHELGIERNIMLLETDRCSVPMTAGILRPRLIVPSQFSEWTSDRRQVVVLHELGHVKRWDCLTKLVVQLASAVYWFNPAVWLARKWTQIEAEQACDDLVLHAGSTPRDYAEHLLEIAAGRQSGRLAACCAISMARRSKLEGRLLAIMDPMRSRRQLTRIGALLLALTIATTVAVIACVQAAGPDAPLPDELKPGEYAAEVLDADPEQKLSWDDVLQKAIATKLPKNWTMLPIEIGKVTPTLWPEGEGLHLSAERKGYVSTDWKRGLGGEVHVWVMGKAYSPRRPKDGSEYAQVPAASEIEPWRGHRVLIWGGGDWKDWKEDIQAALKTVTLTAAGQVGDKTAWGPAVEGVQVRLRADKTTWKEGTVPGFKVDVRNRGTRDLHVFRVQGMCEVEVEVDGTWRRWGGAKPETGYNPLPPGREYDDIPISLVHWWRVLPPGREYDDIPISLVHWWRVLPTGRGYDDIPISLVHPLVHWCHVDLSAGKHTIRVACMAMATKNAPGKPVRAVSNPVEIEIVAENDEKDDAPLDHTLELLRRFETATYYWQQLKLAEQIVKAGDRSVISQLLPHLDSEDEHLRCNAGFVLAGLGDDRGLEAIISELKTKKARLSQQVKSDTGKPFLEQRYGYYAIHVLGKLRDERAVPVLIEFLDIEEKHRGIEWALGEIGDKRAIGALKRVLEHDDPRRHLWAACALAKLGDPLGIPTVAGFLKDPTWVYRRHAVEGLGASDDTAAVPHLIEALGDDSPDVRVSACKALAELADARALPALEKLLGDRTKTETSGPTMVRDDASEAIASILAKQQKAADRSKPGVPMIEKEAEEESLKAGDADAEASALSSFDFGVERFQFFPGVFDSELPIDSTLLLVGMVGPVFHFGLQFSDRLESTA